MAELQEAFWDNLLEYIRDRTVVPVIGSDLVTVREGGQDLPLYRWLAQRLAADLSLPTDELPAGFDLNDVVSLHLRRRGEREELYPSVHRILRKADLTPPESLQALAGITGFNLFVSLTFDSLLAEALEAERGGGPPVEVIAYSPKSVRDLPAPKAELRQPVVFHLLGRASASPDFAICDEDLLELLHALQDRQRQPKTLFDELRNNHLLILGCRFGDWLTRFFLRTARSLELSQRRKRWDVLVGDHIAQEAGLVLFLESFSSDTHVVPLTSAQFVAKLARRWQDRTVESRVMPVAPPEIGTAGAPDGAIFVSYASEDLEAASRLVEGLRAAGLAVWFDKAALQLGVPWQQNIQLGIEKCALFLPVISRQTLSDANRRSFFWTEWNEAVDRARGMAPNEPFIVPVTIDDTSIDRAESLPDSFKRAQAASLPGGSLSPDVAQRLLALVQDFHRRRRAR